MPRTHTHRRHRRHTDERRSRPYYRNSQAMCIVSLSVFMWMTTVCALRCTLLAFDGVDVIWNGKNPDRRALCFRQENERKHKASNAEQLARRMCLARWYTRIWIMLSLCVSIGDWQSTSRITSEKMRAKSMCRSLTETEESEEEQ